MTDYEQKPQEYNLKLREPDFDKCRKEFPERKESIYSFVAEKFGEKKISTNSLALTIDF